MDKYIYLQDLDFLKIIDELPTKTLYIRLTVKTLQNKRVGTIEGMVTGGNLSVNGTSIIRRTGSLSMIADETNYQITELKNIIYMNKKVEVEIGYKNLTSLYRAHDIIWFPLGVFIMANANIQKNNSGISISLNLKDQMTLLNGESGGTFETTVAHSPMNVEKIDINGFTISEEYVSFYKLIYELVTQWGGIPADSVIIEDVPLKIKNIVRWVGKTDVFLTPVTVGTKTVSYELSSSGEENNKYEFGDSIGYTEVDYVYPTESELISNAGDSITSVLDKIKAALGNYEYFFDVYGVFHFQKIKDYIDESGVGLQSLEDALNFKASNYLTNKSKSVYSFEDGKIITSYSNAPVWENVKNDFIVWGKNDAEQAIRYHLIIDTIPDIVFAKETYVYGYIDYFGVYRFAKSEEEAKMKIQYVAQKEKENNNQKIIVQPTLEGFDLVNVNEIKDWRIKAYFSSVLDENKYFYSKEIIEELPKIYDFSNTTDFPFAEGVSATTVSYWIDIINNEQLEKFTVSNIGKRTKTFNNDKINCLFEPYFPDVYFIQAGTALTKTQREEYFENDKAFYQMQEGSYQNLAIGMVTNSAYENLRAQIHTLLSFNESVSIGMLPIYYLEPNSRVTIEDEETSISGDYIIKSFSLPLTANGTMTLQCVKAVERI